MKFDDEQKEPKWKKGDLVYDPEGQQVYEIEGRRDPWSDKLVCFNLTNPGVRIYSYGENFVPLPPALKKQYKNVLT